MIGKRIRMARLFDGDLERGTAIVAAVDHGMFQGVSPGLERLGDVVPRLAAADALLLGPGMIEHVAMPVARRAGPMLASRVAFTSAYCFPWDYHEGHTRPMFGPAHLMSLSADIVVSSLQLHTGSQRIDAENAEVWGRIVEEKERIGMPLIGEFHPAVYEGVDPDEWHALIGAGCRILCELGADIIKTFFTDDRFEEIAASVPVPILILGSKKLPHERDALLLAERAVAKGARGIAIGRNIFQARDPARMLAALRAVIKERVPTRDALALIER